MNTATVTEWNSVELADKINAELAAGKTVIINGEKAVAFHGTPKVHPCQNGTLSYEVRAKVGNKTRAAYIKVGNVVNWVAN